MMQTPWEIEREVNEGLRARIAQLEAALVEERAERNYYRTLGGQSGSWDNECTGFQGLFQRDARTELEELGLLTKLQNGAK